MWINPKSKAEALTKQLSEPSQLFRESRDHILEQCITIVHKEHQTDEEDFIDQYLKREKQSLSEKTCMNCGCEADITFRVCRNCSGKVVKNTPETPNFPKLNIDIYKSFEQYKSKPNNIKCTVGEPDFVNPNSFQSIIQVIQNIGVRAGITQYGGNSREWLLIECDGLPYNTLRDIISNVWRCTECINCFYEVSSFQDHKCYILHNAIAVREFGWLIPVRGLLHLEMIFCRSFMKLNWDVFTSAFANELGFKSPKAQEYIKKGSDHHKLWHFMEIIYVSLTLELVVPYVKYALNLKEIPSTEEYWSWCNSLECPNYIYMQEMTLTYLHSLMLLRSGVRKSNAIAVQDSVAKLSHLIFNRNHPIYQNILYNNGLDICLMPSNLKNIMEQYISGNKSGKRDKCQGGDALLEEVNKESKAWLKMAGVHTEQQWIRVFRNLDNLSQVIIFI